MSDGQVLIIAAAVFFGLLSVSGAIKRLARAAEDIAATAKATNEREVKRESAADKARWDAQVQSNTEAAAARRQAERDSAVLVSRS